MSAWIDRLRWPLALLLLGWLVFMGLGYARTIQERTSWIEGCKDDVQACGGRRVFLALVEVVEVGAESFVVRKATIEHRIFGPVDELEVGQTVSVVARFEPEQDRLVQQSLEHHPWREEKEALGFVGLALAGLVVLGGFRLGPSGLEERA